ncbi:MAG: HEAT repeat domain-containing protein, partial [Myxococcales bacterium]|nr:HEAT repeat domain-containing protein [Myxococcales bacterium]
ERRRAARALTRLRARSALAAMRRAAKSRDEGLRIEAVVGGALLGDAELRKQLPKLIQRPDLPPALRRDALLALAGAGDKRVTAELCRVLDASKDIYDRIEIIEALGQLGDVRAAFALRRQLSTLRTRRFAIRALGHIGARSVVPELIAAMRTDRFISVREHAAEALGRIRDQRALADLRAVVRREVEPSVVARALESLGRLDALTVRGVSMLEGKWQCSGDVCRMSLGEHCGASGELVLLVADSVRQLDARCGGRKLAEIDRRAASSQAVPNKSAAGADRPLPPPALVAQLEGKGLLVLTATAPAPEVRFVGLRPTPSAPSPVRPLVPATLPKRKTKAKTKTKTKTSSEAK